MKYFLSVCLFLIIITSFAPKTEMNKRQVEKTGTLLLTKQETEELANAVNDSDLPGNRRKVLLNKIGIMYQSTWLTKTDSSVNKPIKP